MFVGIYWESYGWVAPDEDVSGLEDEYNLAPPTLPRLMYVKEPADAREPRLVELLGRIRNDDMASFKYFSTATELVLGALTSSSNDQDEEILTELAVAQVQRRAGRGDVGD